MTSLDTRQESLVKIDKRKMYQGIIEVLKESSMPLIAEEIAARMKLRGYQVEPNRQGIQPRCTELVAKGRLAEYGAALNERTKNMNVRYVLTEEEMECAEG